MPENQSSYRSIMKATSMFGGVQVFNILIAIIRSKIVAVLLGPAGMGIIGLLTAATGMLSSLTNFGVGVSAVRNVAEAKSKGNETRIATIIIVLRRLVWITGTLGTLVTLILSPWLSQLTFGNKDYTLAFIWIAITLLFKQLTSGQLALLQGMRKLKYLAKANLYGSFFGLLVTMPLYYKFGFDAIVPVIIITSLISLLFSWYFSKKIIIKHVRVSKIRTIAESKSMLTMGFMISLSGLITLGASYIVRIFISNKGGISDVGLYNAGFAIINTYVGLIFSAMSADYYPRLSAVAYDNKLSKQTINQQAEIVLLILAPILLVLLVFINWAVLLLYSEEFISINTMIYWASLGMFFKAASWSIATIFLAKGNSKLFLVNELITNIYLLIFNILGYNYFGLTGLGLSFLLAYFIYLIQVYIIAKIKYGFKYEYAFIKIFLIQFLLAICSFLVVKFIGNPNAYFIGVILILISSWYSFKELDKRIGIGEIIKSIFKN